MMRKTAGALIAILIACAACVSAVDKQKSGTELSSAFNPQGPTTQEEKLNAAELAVLGEVASIAEEQQPERAGGRKERVTHKKYIAIVRVLETYKGSAAGGTIDVEFMRSDMRERPPLIDFSRGEKCTLFLVHSETAGRFRTLSASVGKEPPGYMAAVPERGKLKKEQGGVTAVLKAAQGNVTAGGPVNITLMVVNNTQGIAWAYTDIAGLTEFTVTGPDGKKIEPERVLSMLPGDIKPFILMPKHFIGALIDLSEKYKFTSPGVYTVAARVPAPSASASSMPASLVSNTVNITVGQ